MHRPRVDWTTDNVDVDRMLVQNQVRALVTTSSLVLLEPLWTINDAALNDEQPQAINILGGMRI